MTCFYRKAKHNVELVGFEPTTFALPARRSSQLSYSPSESSKYSGYSVSILIISNFCLGCAVSLFLWLYCFFYYYNKKILSSLIFIKS